MAAADEGHVEAVAALLRRPGIALDCPGGEGFTALHAAAKDNHAPVVERLLAAGASWQVKDKAGRTAREVATGVCLEVLSLYTCGRRKLPGSRPV